MTQSSEDIAVAFVKAINQHDLDQIAKLMSHEHCFVDSLGTVVRGREKMREAWAAYFRMVPDYAITVDETFCRDSIVVMLGRARGTYLKKGGKALPENAWRTPAAWRARIEEELVVEWRVYADNEPIRQLKAKNT